METKIFNNIKRVINESDNEVMQDFLSDMEYKIVDANDADAIREIFYDWNAEQEVIYYRNACNFIKNWLEEHNDLGMQYMFEILYDYGYNDVKHLNSELIATILTQHDNDEAFNEIFEEIEEAFNDEDESED